MKHLILLILSLTAFTKLASAQSATLHQDTVVYKGVRLYPHQEIQLLYGVKPDKSFVFVYINHVGEFRGSSYAKQMVTLERAEVMDGKLYVRGKLKNVTGLETKKILIDVEGAIDNNEIRVP